MSFYFLNEAIRQSLGIEGLNSSNRLPVRINRSTWEHFEDPPRMAKNYTFDNKGQLSFFVAEIIEVSEIKNHEVKIIIEGNIVSIETYTHDLQDVTELDLEIARLCDQVFQDSLYSGMVR
jgi:pterin-4a-carbinolamine dehydratase